MKKKKSNYGDGSIFFSNVKGKWMGQINVGKDENGKIKRKSVTGDSQKEVKEKLNQIKFEIYSGSFVDSSEITFYQLMKQIIDDKLNMNEIKIQSWHRLNETLLMCKEINNIPIQELDYLKLKSFLLSKLDYADSSIKKIYELLNQCFREAKKRKIISDNPMEDIKRPKSKKATKKIRALTIEEQQKLIAAIEKEKPKYYQQMLISMFTGMRMGEINALTINDINLNFNFINIDKTISEGGKGEAFINTSSKTRAGNRTIPINKFVKPIIDEILKEHNPKDEMLFRTPVNKLVDTGKVNYEFKRIIKNYNIKDESIKGDLTCHSLRHTYATRCIEGGMPPKVLQKLLGHTDISVTLDTYSDVFENYESENVEKIDNYLSTINIMAS